ncbi:MAG: hypothetical protein Q9226_005463 [Calogaya cf. arnoldii]
MPVRESIVQIAGSRRFESNPDDYIFWPIPQPPPQTASFLQTLEEIGKGHWSRELLGRFLGIGCGGGKVEDCEILGGRVRHS